jgi:hypothetical protein
VSGEQPKPALRGGVAWLEAWGLWKSDVSGYLVAQSEACPAVPEPPPRFARAARIAEKACEAPNLPEALKVLARADRAVERGLLLHRPLPWSEVSGRSRVDSRLSSVASLLVSWDVEVRCWNRAEWRVITAEIDEYLVEPRHDAEGLAFNQNAHLNGHWCDVLADFPAERTRARVDDADALLILAHEATHVGIGGSEAQVQCHALQSVRETATLLSSPPRLARDLAIRAWDEFHYYPAEYRSAACRPGGAWDETPNDGVWP